jgi:coenzyme Q-binding protein COQ10
MPHFSARRRVSHAPDNMFALVADVERYPEFLPLCTHLVLKHVSDLGDGRQRLDAEMGVGYKALRETFRTQVDLHPGQRHIDVAYIDGPFKYLKNTWDFIPVPGIEGQCEIVFDIDYAFKNRAFALVMGAMFDRAFRLFAQAFEARADSLYGKRVNRSL